MSAAAFMAAMEAGPSEFATSATTSLGSGTTSLNKPSGLEVGDVVLVISGEFNSTTLAIATSGGSSWAGAFVADGIGQRAYLHWKVMTQTDVDNAWSLTNGDAGLAAAVRYRGLGADTVTVKSSGYDAASSTLTLTGFAKAVDTYGVVAAVVTQSADPATPSGFVERYSAAVSGQRIELADNMAGYVDGAAVAFTPVGQPNQSYGFLVEITGQ